MCKVVEFYRHPSVVSSEYKGFIVDPLKFYLNLSINISVFFFFFLNIRLLVRKTAQKIGPSWTKKWDKVFQLKRITVRHPGFFFLSLCVVVATVYRKFGKWELLKMSRMRTTWVCSPSRYHGGVTMAQRVLSEDKSWCFKGCLEVPYLKNS